MSRSAFWQHFLATTATMAATTAMFVASGNTPLDAQEPQKLTSAYTPPSESLQPITIYRPYSEQVPKQTHNRYFPERSSTLDDIIEHNIHPYHTFIDGYHANHLPGSIAHEGTHAINHRVAETIGKKPQYKNLLHYNINGRKFTNNFVTGVYLGEGRALIIKAPSHLNLSCIGRNVPKSLRTSGYEKDVMNETKDIYGVPYYNPGRILDEASAHLIGLRTAREHYDKNMTQNAIDDGRFRNYVQASGAHLAYLLTLLDVIENMHERTNQRKETNQPYKYSRDRCQMRAAVQILVKGLADEIRLCSDYERYPGFDFSEREGHTPLEEQKDFLDLIENSPDCENIRQTCAKVYGPGFLPRCIYKPFVHKPEQIADNGIQIVQNQRSLGSSSLTLEIE